MIDARAGRVWTGDETARLRTLWDDGLSAKEIARALGRTPQAIAKCARRLGLQPRRPAWADDHDATLRELWDTELPAAAIAAVLGRTADAVCFRASALGLTRRPGNAKVRPGSRRWAKLHRSPDFAVGP